MALKHSYTLLAPIYDALISGPMDAYRQLSMARMTDTKQKKILINGIGSGLDIPYLPSDAIYTGTDITPAMLNKAKQLAKNHSLDINFQVADSQALPFDDDSFDIVVMHLILAVVPNPTLALQEVSRVLKPGGRVYIFDKFLKPKQIAPLRRLLNIVMRHIATRTDVIFEDTLKFCPKLKLIHDKPSLAKGWFRLIELSKL